LAHALADSTLPTGGGDPIRVLFLAHTGLLGGAEIMLEHMATGLVAEGIEPVVALGSDGPLVDRLRRAAIAVHVLPVGSLAGARRRRVPLDHRLLLDGVNWVRAVSRLVRTLEVDVVVTNSQKAHLAGSTAARISGVPVVWRLHDIVVPETFGPAQILALRLTAAVARPRVLGVSRAVEAAVKQTLRIADSVPLHNGIDASHLRSQGRLELRGRFGWPSDSVVFGMVGRLVRWKGCLDFVEAAPHVLRAAPAARFVLVGDEMIDVGSGFRDEIVNRIGELGITDEVRLLPFTDQVGAVLADLDVLVQPSTEPDPFPTAVVEAAVMGVPVIATNHGGVAEIVGHGVHGHLVEPGSVPALADACTELAVDDVRRERMAAAIRADSAGLTAPRMCAGLARELRLVSERRLVMG
jgi:glycosyltransferase involved in cell wall biosynthesis